MPLKRKLGLVAAVLAAAGAVLTFKHRPAGENDRATMARPAPAVASESAGRAGRPRLLELGSVTCIPCRMMAEVLDALRRDYGPSLQVDFIDVDQQPAAGRQHKLRMIPTQIFFGPDGRELFRHEGYFAASEIVAKWGELGYVWPKSAAPEVAASSSTGWLGTAFGSLSQAVEGSGAIACGAALVWGMLSILLSPCHLASIPLIVGFINGQGRISTGRAGLIATLFATGILLTIAGLGAASAAAGQMLGEVGPAGNLAVAGVFLLVGLHLLEAIPAPWSGPGQVAWPRRGLLAAFLLGLIFGLALGPCTFAYMAPLLAVTFKLGAENLPFGVTLLLLYGLGHCSVIVLAGTFTEAVQHYLNWNERSRGALLLKRICGLLVIGGGLYLLGKT